MPNWCENDLEVTGPEEDLSELMKEPLSLKRFIPVPAEFEIS